MSQVMLPHQANVAGNVHGGEIMKFMDTAAGAVAMKYSRSNCVTARVDELIFHLPIFVGALVTCTASIAYVGNTSMDVYVRVDSEEMCIRDRIKREVSDGVIAPGYTDEALEILKSKKKGNYNIVKIDQDYVPCEIEIERKQVFGITFEQKRNDFLITKELLNNFITENKELNEDAKRDLVIALITLKYTQSNSVAYAKDGQTIGVGACLLYTSS